MAKVTMPQLGESVAEGTIGRWLKKPGDRVVGATVNGTGSLILKAERVGAETLLARIVQMVAEAQRSRAPIQKLADQVGLESEIMTPVKTAFSRALDLSVKDGSIVLSAGSMFVTAEVMTAWDQTLKTQVSNES